METPKKRARREAIEAAAYKVLITKGYTGASMLEVARAAKSSNETLYRWYGDKVGLFSALIAQNAEAVRELLATKAGDDPLETLKALGPELYTLLTSDKAIALNRAAACDPSGELGRVLGRTGRDTIGPLIGDLMAALRDNGLIDFGTTAEVVSLYLDLLIGDHQIRRAIGTMDLPGPAQISARADLATTRFLRLAGRSHPNSVSSS